MKNIIFSGFKKFGDYEANSTQIVGQKINETVLAGYRIRSLAFDTSVSGENYGNTLLEFAIFHGASGIISTGMASEKTGPCIESVATNLIYHEKYVKPALNNTPINQNRLYNEKIALDLLPWNIPKFHEKCRQKKIATMEVSTSTDSFCCNRLRYQFCIDQLKMHSKIPFIFFHIPCCPEAVADMDAFTKAGKVTMAADQVVETIKLLLETASL